MVHFSKGGYLDRLQLNEIDFCLIVEAGEVLVLEFWNPTLATCSASYSLLVAIGD